MRAKAPIAVALGVALVGAGALSASAVGATFSWATPSGNWSVNANWSPAGPIGADDNLVFAGGSSSNNDMAAGFNVRSLDFSGGIPFLLTGNQIDLVPLNASDVTVNATLLGTALVTADLALPTSQQWSVGSASTLSLDGTVAVAAGAELILPGSGLYLFQGPLNGAAGASVDVQGTGIVLLDGGGNMPDLDSFGGAIINVGSLFPALDVTLDSGFVSGGSDTNDLGADEQIAALLIGSSSALSPGSDFFGQQIGAFSVSGLTRGTDDGTFIVQLDGTDNDRLATGTFQPDDLQLQVQRNSPAPVGTEFEIVRGSVVANSFFTTDGIDQLLDGDVFESEGGLYRINYTTERVFLTFLGENVPANVLPPTGVDPTVPIGIAGVLLLLGAGALVLVTRRIAAE